MTAAPAAIFPTSFAQERMWIVERLAPGSAAYNVPIALRLRGALDHAALRAALSLVVERHEVLRTVFDQVDGRTVQRIEPAEPVHVEVADVPGGDTELPALLAAGAATGFALDRDLLLRASLYRLGVQDHVLAVTLHHLVSDMWSLEVLLRELSVAYDALAAGREPTLPDLPLQYVDYAIWQREQLSDARREDLLGYWRTALADAPPVLELPTDRLRPAVQRFAGAEVPVSLAPALSRDVRDLARRLGVTPFMTLLGAFGAVLGRLAGADDVVVGTAVGSRDRQTEPLIGCFLNTLPLRVPLSGDPTFAELLGRVRKVTFDALEHQDLPFDKLVEDLAPRRDLSHNPISQVLFLVQNAPEPTAALSGLSVEPVHVERGGTQCDLSVQLREIDGRFAGFVEYAVDLFDAATIGRWWGHLESLLAAAVADPDAPLSALPCLSPAEIGRIVGGWNATEAELADVPLAELVTRRAAVAPDATALVWSDGELSYADLDRRAGEVAAALLALGAGAGERVAVHGDRDADLVAAILGVLGAGAAYVPLNTDYPRDRLALMLADARPAVVLTQRRRAAELPPDRPVLLVDDLPRGAGATPPTVQSTDPAYVIYTSGSTGAPKGVLVEHRSVANLLAWMQRHYPIGADDVLLLKTPTSFDVSVCELFWWALAGARLALLPVGAEKDPRALLAEIARHGVTVVQFVPSMLGPFLDLLAADQELVNRAASLRYVLCAGEDLPTALVERFDRAFSGSAAPPMLANLYGPTEATVYASAFDCPPGGRPGSGRAPRTPIGTPLDNVGLYVLDPADRVQPVGVPGELGISGTGLARGYLGRPGLTAERFVPNPYAGVAPGVPAGSRMYRTGDLCRYTPTGAVEWLGRLDFQVKVRGFRVEPGEISAALAAHPRVVEAVVVPRQDGPDGSGRLVAYYVATAGAEPTWSELRAFLRRTLPEHMMPEAFVALEVLPLSPNGKIDRKALPAPTRTRPVLDAGFVAPRTSLEQVVAEVWLGVLQVGRVGVEDDFFDLGGQSLLATQVASALQETLGVEVPLRAMFEARTVAAQAELVGRSGRDAGMNLEETAALVLQVRELTDDQVRELLAVQEG